MVVLKEGILIENKILVTDSTFKGTLVEKGFGENKGRELILDLYEGLYLLAKYKIIIKKDNKKLLGKDLLELGLKQDKEFYSKSLVYSDIRENGYTIKTGLKFGFDFRVYPKGKTMGESHSQFGINVTTENTKLSMTQISRITRLAGNIHIKAITAVVDHENSINYYSIDRKLF
ncbi:MAG: tRNA-intron lyase [archaeon]|jgi:tRNA-intron endonuclease